MVNGLRGTARPFAWQVQHLESLGAASGQRSPRDRAPFCVAGAALREPGRCLLHVEFHDVFPRMSETCGETQKAADTDDLTTAQHRR